MIDCSFGLSKVDKLVVGPLIHIYGESGVGKTTLALQAIINTLKKTSKKAIFIDTGKAFDGRRFKQLCEDNADKIMKNIIIFTPKSPESFSKVINYLPLVAKSVKIIVVDTVTSFYEEQLQKSEKKSNTTQALYDFSWNIAFLKYISKSFGFCTILVNNFLKTSGRAIGNKIVQFWTDTDLLITLERDEFGILRRYFIINGTPIKVNLTETGFSLHE